MSPPSPPDDTPPRHNDAVPALSGVLANRYRIEGSIGAGGMATVYRARDLQHDTTVAIKAPHPELVLQLGGDRFAREVRISVQLQHPHIVPVFDSGTVDGVPFYVMPFIEGETLEARLKREGALPIPEAIEIACQVLDGLAYAHRHGFVHRDVKPANVLLSHGHALLADFGIARVMEKADATRLTESGFAVGTVDYMSPEQASASSQVDGRSDQYALACVLYEMLAGQPPFAGNTARSVMARHMIDPPPPLRTVRATVSPRLEQVVMTALAKLPADRFPSAGDFRDALRLPDILVDAPSGGGATAGASSGELPARGAPASGASAAASAIPGDRVAAVESPRRRWPLVATIAAALAGIAALVTWQLRVPRPLAVDANRVMVYPFVAPDGLSGSRTAGEDVATIVGNALDGAGPLRWVDGWALLDAARRDDIRSLTLDAARDLALSRRCATFITGRLVALGDSVKVFLTLHDARGDSVLAERAASGSPTEPWRQALNAFNGVLPSLIPGGSADVSAEWANRPPGAVASFLLAESAFRRVQLTEALGHYREAVRRDSTFALAAIRGAQAASWNHREDEARSIIQVALARPLPARYAAFARGFLHYLDGRPDSAVHHLDAAIAADPEMGVAWMQLGEVYTHLLPLKGNVDSLADAAFTRARALDTTAANVLLHPIQFRLRRGDVAGAGTMLQRFRAGAPDTLLAAALTLDETCVRDGADAVDWRREAAVRPLAVLSAANALRGEGARFECAQRAFAAVLALDSAATDAADARRWVALLGLQAILLLHGKPDSAVAVVDATIARWGFGATIFLLGAPVTPAYVERARGVARQDSAQYGANYVATPFALRLWELGVLEATLGRADVAEAVARELQRRASAGPSRQLGMLARSVGAVALLARGDSAGAERQLVALLSEPAIGDILAWDEAEPRGGERLLLARLLLARGAYQEAIDVANVFDSSWPIMHLLYLPASLELRAAAADSLGNVASAAHYRARLAALRGGRLRNGA